MSTSEAQVIARALYDSLMNSTLQALKSAAGTLHGSAGADVEQRITAALPADAPRQLQNLLLALAKEGTLDRLPNVARAFEGYLQESEEQAGSAEITSAESLSETQQSHITDELRARYGRKLDVRFVTDPSIIGGLVIRIGDQVLDNSLRARLSAIQRNMQAG